MKYLILMALVCLPCFSDTNEELIARRVGREIKNDTSKTFEVLKKKSDMAMNAALDLAVQELRKKGEEQVANNLEIEWAFFYGKSLFKNPRGIGAHKPINKWIADQYELIESILGRDFCIRSHIADIKSLNYGVPVTVDPCKFPMDGIEGMRATEYKRHFCGKSPKVQDEPYFGTVPVVTYWTVYVGCLAGTSGTGYSFACGFSAEIAERVCASYIAPGLSDFTFKKACGGIF